ncbi:hypothetical protein [Streptomyces netropsis]|uniref:Uncharacterized protein n=1 Tax=Streptomyces netropsis TaxID=55404 RepID=A0A7W7LGY8_STRNE|nr:hypothetical protein [Streptomyces netropsis]MBB4890007.1 hypothetical protein [Streptomyces netropsis]GGR42615.1 hypothetical protein GCM10010219_55070 [Streptomyces netropsis]
MTAASDWVQRSTDRTYWAWDSDGWETKSPGWQDVPGAKVGLTVGGSMSPSYGAVFVVTFSAETLVSSSDHNSVLLLDVLFGGESPNPVSDNHRFSSAASSAEWSSHTALRIISFEPQFNQKDVTAQVRVSPSDNIGTAGLQNWALKIERYNL